MSRRLDRKKQDEENSASVVSKDESDAATLRSSDCGLHLHSARSADPHPSLPQLKESNALQLLSEAGIGETKPPDCKSSILDSLNSLENKIKVLLERTGLSESSDKDSVELQVEMTKLLQATKKQKDDFSNLYETVHKQKDMLQRLEAKAKSGSLAKPIASAAVDSRIVTPIQCCHDLETREDLEATMVLLISGRYEFRRRVGQSSDALINVYIPDSVNLGSRMLPGRQSFPNALLQSLTFDATENFPNVPRNFPDVQGNFPNALTAQRLGAGLEIGAMGGRKEPMGSEMTCPICALVFPSITETPDAFELHVQRHFVED